jgi:hypothetical protein
MAFPLGKANKTELPFTGSLGICLRARAGMHWVWKHTR